VQTVSEGIYTALSGAVAQETALEIIANNLANVATKGFKGDSIDFKEVLAQGQKNATNAHVELTEIRHDFSQGLVKATNGRLDVALLGNGFFVVEGPQGDMLTRDGALTKNGSGFLQNTDGLLVQGQNGPIRVAPGASVRIDSYGGIFVTPQGGGGAGGAALTEFMQDRLRVVDVEEPQKLQRAGHGLWDPAQTQLIACDTPVEVGALEQSNVNPIHMMTRLIATQRAYENYNKTIQQIHTTEQKATSQLG
jgi:flagellar basal-body rod protein FlgF